MPRVRPRQGPVMRATISGYYQLVEGSDGAFVFTLRAGNHETVLTSRVFWTRQAALDGAAALVRLSQQPDRYVQHHQAGERGSFEVLDDEGEPLARSVVYSNRSSAAAGMASVRRNGPATRFRGLVRRAKLAGKDAWPIA